MPKSKEKKADKFIAYWEGRIDELKTLTPPEIAKKFRGIGYETAWTIYCRFHECKPTETKVSAETVSTPPPICPNPLA